MKSLLHQTLYPEDFGARADGETLDTRALQSAIDACHKAGGGMVCCGAGTYRTGSIELKSGVELYLGPGCRISASTDMSDYDMLISGGFDHTKANERTAYYLIGARHAAHIAITGPGTIDGHGPAFYDQTKPLKRSGQFAGKSDQRIRLVMFHKCTDIRLEDTTYVDSPCWTMWLMCCERIHVHRVKIFCDARIINGDGIDFDSCRDITVSDCILNAQDDCLVFRAIQKVHDEPAICENFTVTNCVLSSTRGSIRISCPSDHIVRNGVFSNLIMQGSSNGIALHFPERFLDDSGEGRAEVRNLSFTNCIIQCTRHPIRMIIEDGILLRGVSGIHFSDVRIEGGAPCLIQGSPETPFEDVTLDNVSIRSNGEQALVIRHCRGLMLNRVNVEHGDT